ncbi:MAG: prepilin peptidase [Oligoflexia bacterium]|nr:prepilin peptidase [Oligoflexia bacterium]
MPLGIYIFILIQMAVVGYWDLKTKKISNYWSILNIFLFFILLLTFSDSYVFKVSIFKYPLIILLVGMCLFFAKIMGAGDVKFMATSLLLLPTYYHEKLIWYLLVCTAIFGAFFVIKNTFINIRSILIHLKNKEFVMIKNFYGSRFSYSPVILLSWVCLGWDINIIDM